MMKTRVRIGNIIYGVLMGIFLMLFIFTELSNYSKLFIFIMTPMITYIWYTGTLEIRVFEKNE